MKRLISFFTVLSLLVSLTACGGKGDNSATEGTTKKSAEVYANCAFADLETFTARTKIDLNSKDESFDNTTYNYVTFEESEDALKKYKEYLIKYGFKLTSDVSSETMVFEFEEKKLEMKVTNGAAGTEISITLPLDEATINSNKETAYLKIQSAFDEGNYSECLSIAKETPLGEYKDYEKIISYSKAEDFLKASNWNDAIYYFNACGNFKDAADRYKTLKEQRDSLNGTWEFKNEYGQTHYVLILNGKADMAWNASGVADYQIGEPASYYLTVYKGYITEDGIPFVGGEYTPAKNEEGAELWTPVLGTTKEKMKYTFTPVGDDGGMLLISDNAEHNKILSGIHYKVAEAPPAE